MRSMWSQVNGFQTFLINTANESIQNTFNHFVFEVLAYTLMRLYLLSGSCLANN